MTRRILLSVLLMLGTAGFFGCRSNDPVSTTTEGAGYHIQLGVSSKTVPVQGQILVTASVFDGKGNPVKDEEIVTFSSQFGVVTGDGKILGGVTTATYKANEITDEPSKVEIITASYRGAVANIEVAIVSNTF